MAWTIQAWWGSKKILPAFYHKMAVGASDRIREGEKIRSAGETQLKKEGHFRESSARIKCKGRRNRWGKGS